MAMKTCSGSEAFPICAMLFHFTIATKLLFLRSLLAPFSHSFLLYLSCCREGVLLVVLSREHFFSHGDVEQSGSRDTVENKDRVHRVRNAIGWDAVILCDRLERNTAVHFVARMPMIIASSKCCP